MNRVFKTKTATYSLNPSAGTVNGGWKIQQVVVYTPEELKQIEIEKIQNDENMLPATKAKMIKQIESKDASKQNIPNFPSNSQ